MSSGLITITIIVKEIPIAMAMESNGEGTTVARRDTTAIMIHSEGIAIGTTTAIDTPTIVKDNTTQTTRVATEDTEASED
jgi:hypothetical protein